MSVFRPKWKRDGKETTGRVYWMDVRVNGKRHRKSLGVSDKAVAIQREAEIVKQLEMAAVGMEDHTETAAASLADLIDEYEQELVRRRSSRAHVQHTAKRVRDVAGRSTTLSDLTPARIRRSLSRLGTSRKLTAKTINGYRTATSGFFGWLVQEGRWPTNPVAQVKRVRETEPARQRRAYSREELERLFAAVPHERATCYRVAATTGLRRGELRALTWADLDLGAATVRVRASTSKNRKTMYLPLPERTVAELRRFKGRGKPEGPIFSFIPSTKRLKKDLAAADVDFETPDGVADFHALRVTYATMLARAGVSLVQAQKLMRHSDPKLTANIYTRLQLDDAHAAVARMGL